ncbi:serine hydrolase [Bacillus sp. MUM 13]|uniref:serine hydrolase n=1 Tax=Bacillus sp. MUM 13 TaxID=1678001 RepID=UPI0008F57A41|nr:serine hydrolase [Bacillus sp. MUM 13]OIK07175.1 D-alanyl-D-alanine carboxypeptidase [Bacillus sp. MUM 13]
MKRITQISLVFTLLFVLVASQFSYNPRTAKAAEDNLGLKADAALIVDAKTGKIIYEKNANKVMGIASMSKMMTEYLVLDAIEDKKISWDTPVKINEYVHNLSKAPNLSNVGLTQGEEYKVKELYEAMAIYSGNAATVALTEKIAGSETNFIPLMNKKGKELGLKHFKFVNATGLSNKDLLGHFPTGDANDENVMTAKDVGLLAYRLLKDHPQALDYASISKLKFRDGKTYPNFNWMLPGLIYHYDGVDGLKTGSTDFAGYAFAGTVKRNGQRYITIVMKSTSKAQRFVDAAKLMNYAYDSFKKTQILPANYVVKGKKTLPVAKGKEDSVKIKSKSAIDLVVKNNGEEKNYTPQLVIDKSKLNKDGELTAPIKKGEKIGYLTVKKKDGSDYGFLNKDGDKYVRSDVVAAETVEKANWFALSMHAIGGFFADVWDSASSAVKGWF